MNVTRKTRTHVSGFESIGGEFFTVCSSRFIAMLCNLKCNGVIFTPGFPLPARFHTSCGLFPPLLVLVAADGSPQFGALLLQQEPVGVPAKGFSK
jgi:hypothetical protein